MLPRAVFAITCAGDDIYHAMTRIAVGSLRITNPDIIITVACDHPTYRILAGLKSPLIDQIDDLLPVETPPGPPSFRNRFVKTSLRQLISGPFLFLDSDILVRGDLTPLACLDCDFAAARNHSTDVPTRQINNDNLADLQNLGWQFREDVYLNGGVLYFAETPTAHALSREWHRRWLWHYKATGKHYDQPALNATVFSHRPGITVLADIYNAQFPFSPGVALGAVIWHYYSSYDSGPPTDFSILVSDITNGLGLSEQRLKEIICKPHPWCSSCPIDDWAIRRMLANNRAGFWEQAWLRRRNLSWGYGVAKSSIRSRAKKFLSQF